MDHRWVRRARQKDLEAWAGLPDRKPLIVRGARQVGKSYLVRSFGAERFRGVAEANLERRPELSACFADNDPRAALRRLEVVLGRAIPADGSTLLFLDEIQAAPQVLAKLRWFAEELPQLPVIAAGSLLDFALRSPEVATPVGRIGFLHLEPMGFEEFCLALGEDALVRWLGSEVTVERIAEEKAMPDELHGHALKLFRTWLLVGGMPAAVEAFRGERSLLAAATVQRDLLATLRDDFAKYAGRVPHERLRRVLDSIPQQLGGKFTYRRVDRDERAAGLKQAVELLCLARVCHRVRATPARGLPLGAGADDDAFKLLHLDVGLVSTSLGLDLRALESAADLTLVNQGALAEQAVGQLLRLTFAANDEPALYWWRREKKGSEAELDFVHAQGSRVLPIEVKSGKTGTLRSLHTFMAERGLSLALRVNAGMPALQDIALSTPLGSAKYRLLSIPAYLVEHATRLLAEIG
jgi:hypothetical protein